MADYFDVPPMFGPSWPSGYIFDTVGMLLGDSPAMENDAPENMRKRKRTPLKWIPDAWVCIDLLTNELSSFPFTAYREVWVDGYERPIAMPVDPASKYAQIADFLTMEVSDQLDPNDFWRFMWWQVLSTGNAYARIHRSDPRGWPVKLEPVTRIMPPQRHSSMPLKLEPYRFHQYPTTKFDRADVLALHGSNYNAWRDCSPSPYLVIARHLGFLDEGIAELTEALTDPRNLYSIKTDFPEEAAELADVNTDALIDAMRTGMDPVLINAEVFRRQPGTSVRTMGRTEDFRHSKEVVLQVFGVPPRSMGHLSAGMRTEAPIMSQRADLAIRGLTPRSKMIQSKVQYRMLSGNDRAGGYRITLDIHSELRGTLKERAEVGKLLQDAGLWTPSEGRVLTGKPPKDDDPEADKLHRSQGAGGVNTGSDGDRQSPGADS